MIYAFINPDAFLNGDPHAGSGRRQFSSLMLLLHEAELIPVSGRDEAGLLSVPAVFTAWQILLHGAVVIRPDGGEDPAWRRLTLESQRCHAEAVALAAQAVTHISMRRQLDLEIDLVQRGNHPLLVRVSPPHQLELVTEEAATLVQDWIDAGPFSADLRLLRAADGLAILPRELGADGALHYVMEQLDLTDAMTLGVGAQDSDRAFLALCDFAVFPGASVLNGVAGTDPDD